MTGPVWLPSGELITADNVVPLTLSQVYTRFADDNTARKAYLQTISRTVVADVLAPTPMPAGSSKHSAAAWRNVDHALQQQIR